MLDRWMVLYSPEFSLTTMASALTTCITYRAREGWHGLSSSNQNKIYDRGAKLLHCRCDTAGYCILVNEQTRQMKDEG